MVDLLTQLRFSVGSQGLNGVGARGSSGCPSTPGRGPLAHSVTALPPAGSPVPGCRRRMRSGVGGRASEQTASTWKGPSPTHPSSEQELNAAQWSGAFPCSGLTDSPNERLGRAQLAPSTTVPTEGGDEPFPTPMVKNEFLLLLSSPPSPVYPLFLSQVGFKRVCV